MELINSLIGLGGAIAELCSHPLVQAGFIICIVIPIALSTAIKAVMNKIR